MKVVIKKELIEQIKSCSDSEKGQLLEQISEEFFKSNGVEYQELQTLNIQKNIGDYIIFNPNEKDLLYAEVKSGHTFRKTKTDKLALDYLYFKKYSNCKTPYIQNNSDDNKGWLHYIKAHWLIVINIESLKLYIIRDFQKVRESIIKYTDSYISKISPTIWFHRNYHNNINRFLEGGVKHDSCKESLIVNLTLNRRSIEELGGTLIECDIIITENRNLDRKKPSDNLEVAEGF